ncbi:MAG: hypothetical protein AAF215_10670 [Cyanobacteria bacterium P01_A01_bin.123]
MALTRSVYGHCPQAWWVEVPASDFTSAHNLSALAKRGGGNALQAIEALIDTMAKVQSPS